MDVFVQRGFALLIVFTVVQEVVFSDRLLWARTCSLPKPFPTTSLLYSLDAEPGRHFGASAGCRRSEIYFAAAAGVATSQRHHFRQRESFRDKGHHGGGLGSARTAIRQAGSGSILPLRE